VIFASVRNRASNKIKTIRQNVELEDRVILSNNISNLIEQKVLNLFDSNNEN